MDNLTTLKTETNESANLFFDLINRAEHFGDQTIDIIICGATNDKELWFKGKDIADVLGYKRTRDALKDHVKSKNKLLISDLYQKTDRGDSPRFKGNQKNTIYINEAGLYQLIMKSKLESAEKFQDWVTDDLLPKIRKVGQEKYLQQIQQLQDDNRNKDRLIEEKGKLIEDKDGQLNRLHNIQIELLSYKKKITKDETVYVVSTENYARQGLYKVGRTKIDMKFRSSNHNITHISGDRVEVLASFNVSDSASVEKNIHNKLKGLLLRDEKEFFMCPFDLLQSLVELVVNNDDLENQAVNRIIDTVYRLKELAFNSIDWTRGIPTDVFKKKMVLSGHDKPIEFDVSRWSENYKQEFIANCIKEYIKINNNTTDVQVQIIWKTFQTFLIDQLPIVKSRYKSKEWKEYVKNGVKSIKAGVDQKEPSIKWNSCGN